jgi:cytidylate kinase
MSKSEIEQEKEQTLKCALSNNISESIITIKNTFGGDVGEILNFEGCDSVNSEIASKFINEVAKHEAKIYGITAPDLNIELTKSSKERAMAAPMGRTGAKKNQGANEFMTDLLEAAKNDDSYDKYVDNHQVELAMKESCVLGSRLAIWMLKTADLKVYLFASDETRANRVFNREGGDIEQIKSFTAMRDSEDTKRYKEFYNIDNNNYDFVDLFIDVNTKTPEEIVQDILDKLEEKGLISKVE